MTPSIEKLLAAGDQASHFARLAPPPDARDLLAASVLILLSDSGDGEQVLLTQRASHLRNHAGQVSFPGGRQESQDVDLVATALRETEEETGVSGADVEVLGTWPPLWIPVSNSAVTPVIAWWPTPSEDFQIADHEVERAAQVRLVDLADRENRLRCRHPSGYTGPAFTVSELFVWGFTAGVLDRLLTLGEWEQPWDQGRIVALDHDGFPRWTM